MEDGGDEGGFLLFFQESGDVPIAATLENAGRKVTTPRVPLAILDTGHEDPLEGFDGFVE